MHEATTEPNEHVRFTLHEPRRVVQAHPDGSTNDFDPFEWGTFTRGSLVVHAVKIPRPFRVGGDICRDGYLVYDGRLAAISTPTFDREYRPMRTQAAA